MYEQLKNSFLIELETRLPNLPGEQINAITSALDKASYPYDIKEKEVALTTYVDPIPRIVKMYLVIKRTEGLSLGTLENYRRILFAFFLWARKPAEKITAQDIRMYIYEYQQSRAISDRTLDKYREIICWFFSWAQSEGYIPNNPGKSLKAIKYEVKERQALTQTDLEYVRRSCKTKRETAIIEFLYSTGCRVTELTNVKMSDIDWNEKTVHLFGKGKKHRTSYINAKCEVALKEYLKEREEPNEFLFITERRPSRKLTKCAVEKIVRQMSERCGIDKKLTPHVLRHTTATQAINSGMPVEDVSRLLGHASVATTMIYAKVSNVKVKSEHARCIL